MVAWVLTRMLTQKLFIFFILHIQFLEIIWAIASSLPYGKPTSCRSFGTLGKIVFSTNRCEITPGPVPASSPLGFRSCSSSWTRRKIGESLVSPRSREETWWVRFLSWKTTGWGPPSSMWTLVYKPIYIYIYTYIYIYITPMNTSSLYLPFLAPHCTLQKNNREFKNCNFFEICQSARFLVKISDPSPVAPTLWGRLDRPSTCWFATLGWYNSWAKFSITIPHQVITVTWARGKPSPKAMGLPPSSHRTMWEVKFYGFFL